MGHLLFLCDFLILVLFTSRIVILSRLPNLPFQILFGWVIFHSTLALTGYAFSSLSLLNSPLAILAFHLFLLVIACFISPPKRPPQFFLKKSYSCNQMLSDGIHFLSKIPFEFYCLFSFYFIAFLALIYFNFISQIQLDADSLDYHVPKALYYLQYGSFSAFQTPDIRQTNFPFIMESAIVWIFSFIKDFRYFYLLQWINNFMVCLCIYLICRHINVSNKWSALVSLLWISLPTVIIQSAIAKNDLLVCAFSVVAFFFVFLIKQHFYVSAFGIGLSLGLAIGTKYNALFVASGIILVTLHSLLKNYSPKNICVFFVIILSSIFVVGSYNYIDTFYRTGYPFAHFPHVGGDFRPYYLIINFLRLLVEMTDSVIAWEELIHKLFGIDIPNLRHLFFQFLGIVPFLDVFNPANMFTNTSKPYYDFGYSKYFFSLGVTILLLAGYIRGIHRQNNNTAINYIFAVSLVTFILQASVLSWQLSNLRFFLPMITISFPLIGLGLSWVNRRKIFLIPILLTCVFSIVVITQFYYIHRIFPLQNNNPYTLLYEWLNMNERDKEVIDFVHGYPPDYGVATKAHTINYEALLAGILFDRVLYSIEDPLNSKTVEELFTDNPQIRIILTRKSIDFKQPEFKSHAFEHSNLHAIVKEKQ
jgi:hypothetical protein